MSKKFIVKDYPELFNVENYDAMNVAELEKYKEKLRQVDFTLFFLKHYLGHLLEAKKARLNGDIEQAEINEQLGYSYFKKLPDWAKFGECKVFVRGDDKD